MSRIKEYIKNNLVVVIFLLFLLVFLLIVIIYKSSKNETFEFSPIYGPVPVEIRNRESNEYRIISVDDQDIALAYYKNWLYLLINNPEEAYNSLSDKSKKEFDTFDKFKEWINRYKTVKTKDNTITGCLYKEKGTDHEIIVSDSEHMRYRFNEYSVWNYDVEIIGQERNTEKTTTIVTKK